jgi:hypothetical protein
MALNFFNTSKKHVRQFSIPYRFHDPDQEKRDERESRIKNELVAEQATKNMGEYKSSIKGSFRRSRGSIIAKSGKSNTFIKVLLLIFILSMFAYFFLR